MNCNVLKVFMLIHADVYAAITISVKIDEKSYDSWVLKFNRSKSSFQTSQNFIKLVNHSKHSRRRK